MFNVLATAELRRLLVCEFGHLENLLDHLLLAFLVVGVHGVLETGIQMPLHELLVGGFEQADDRKVLLHDVDAVFAILDHLDDLLDVAAGLLEIELGLLLLLIHKI